MVRREVVTVMLNAINRLGRGVRSVVILGMSALPVLVVGGLLYAAIFLKSEPVVAEVKSPAIERRDFFYGAASPKSDILWAVGSYGKIVHSDNGGLTWAVQLTPVNTHLQAIAAWDVDRAVAVGNRGVVLLTADAGRTWHEIDAPRSEIANKLLQVRAYAGGIGWSVGEMGAVLKTSDYGKTWTRVQKEKDQAWNDIFFVGDGGWMVGEFGRIALTHDGGENWVSIDSPIMSSLMSVHFRDADNGVAVGLTGAVLVTGDGGLNWKEVPRVTREHLNSVIWDDHRWIAVGDKGMRVSGVADGSRWVGGRISDQDLSWRTQIIRFGDGFLLAGASLAQLDNEQLKTFARD
jgi:photosystem II stability/assembly factor-like uncharacterized protein